MFHEALENREKGFSVVPIVEGTKQPPKDFPLKEYFERRPTLGELRQWYGRETRYGIGIITGQISGITVIDLESREEAKDLYYKLPKTPAIVETGRGIHFYYQTNEEVKTRIKAKIKGVQADVKGELGYVLAPPTLHPSGQQYKWIDKNWNLIDVPHFDPEWIDPEPIPEIQDFKGAERRVNDLDAYLSTVKSIQGQNGSKGLFRVCCLARDNTGNFEDAYDYVLRWNESGAASPSWSERELLHALTNAFKKGNHVHDSNK